MPITGRADLDRPVHDLADLLGVSLGQGAAEHGEVLAEDEHQPAIDRAVAGHDAVTRHLLVGHAKIVATMLDEHVRLLEGVRVEQELDALAGGELAALVLRLDPALAAAKPSRRALGIELLEDLLHRAPPAPRNATVR